MIVGNMLFWICCLFVALEGREELLPGRDGKALYRMEVPESWKRVPVEVSQDTKLPIAEFHFQEGKLVIHNFPGMNIPAIAQVERWKRQAKPRSIEPTAFSGYRGLLFEGDEVLAWALEWGATKKVDGEATSPVTLKATGHFDPQQIIEAVRTFEWIQAPCEW